MKTRLDQPHLTPLRYDYALLHECHRAERKSRLLLDLEGLATILAAVIFVSWLAYHIYQAIKVPTTPFAQVEKTLREVK